MKFSQRFKKEKLIGWGSFGKVYKAIDNLTNTKVALKISLLNQYKTLLNESEILKELPSSTFFPEFKWFGTTKSKCILAETYIGNSLQKFSKKYSLTTSDIMMYIHQMLLALETLHEKGFIHQDLKPSNICVKEDHSSDVYLIDFGISERFCDKITKKHNEKKPINAFKGNFVFCSENSICGGTTSRRDDLESLCYIAIYLLKNSLPWVGKGYALNQIIEIRQFCMQKLLSLVPVELRNALKYCKSLKFEEKPDYSYLSKLFLECKIKNQISFEVEVVNRDFVNIKKRRQRTKKNTFLKYLGETVGTDLPELTNEIREKGRENLKCFEDLEDTQVITL